MPELNPSELLERLTWRYAVKQFDSNRKIPDPHWQALEQALILAPSSFGLQPWQFVVVTDPELKKQLPPISWNQTQGLDCSHMVVLAARRSLDAEYVDRFIDSVAQTRGLPKEVLAGYHNVIMNSVKQSQAFHLQWNSRQVYIALGQLMTAAAVLGIDACPMEGIDTGAYDQLLGLTDSHYTTVVACALGYRSPHDKYAAAPKVRFPAQQLVIHK